VTYPKTLVVIDGTDPEQVKWFAASEYDKRLDVTLLLTEGSFGAVSKRISRPLFYADRKMLARLKLKAVPSVIRQNGRIMEVTEVKLPIGQTKPAGKAQHYRKGAP
jgi:conjugal transfer pilus assembly protein TraW